MEAKRKEILSKTFKKKFGCSILYSGLTIYLDIIDDAMQEYAEQELSNGGSSEDKFKILERFQSYVHRNSDKIRISIDLILGFIEEEKQSAKEEVVCYKQCGNTKPSGGKNNICLNCGSSIKPSKENTP